MTICLTKNRNNLHIYNSVTKVLINNKIEVNKMDTKNIIIIALVVVIVVMAMSIGFLMGQQGNRNDNNITNTTNTTNSTNVTNVTPDDAVSDTPSNVEEVHTEDTSKSNQQEDIDYNSPDSEYYKWDTDGSYHKKQEGVDYVYAQDAVTGEWSYWADKT